MLTGGVFAGDCALLALLQPIANDYHEIHPEGKSCPPLPFPLLISYVSLYVAPVLACSPVVAIAMAPRLLIRGISC
jgi:hypothetical protein